MTLGKLLTSALLVVSAASLGQGAPTRAGKTVAELQSRAQAGEPEAQSQLALKYQLGRDVAKNETEAVRWFQKAAEGGHALAQVTLGLMYRDGLNGKAK